jgi:K+-transporting ATPase c subunit
LCATVQSIIIIAVVVFVVMVIFCQGWALLAQSIFKYQAKGSQIKILDIQDSKIVVWIIFPVRGLHMRLTI